MVQRLPLSADGGHKEESREEQLQGGKENNKIQGAAGQKGALPDLQQWARMLLPLVVKSNHYILDNFLENLWKYVNKLFYLLVTEKLKRP